MMKQWTDKHPDERRIKLVPFDQITLTSERRYLVKGLIPYPGLTVVWGPPKSGKSLWAQDVMTRVALDWEYRGRKVHAGPVVYCCFEGQSGIKARVEAFRQKFLAELIDPVPFFLQPVTMDLVKDHGELISVVRETLPDTPPVSIVLDTLNRSLAGSESSDTDMSAYVRAADAIRGAFDCAVVIVHHCGINDSRPRGHTSLTGAADAQKQVAATANDEVPEIPASGVQVNDAGQTWRNVQVRLPEGMVSDDLRSQKIWRRVQESRMAALIKYDHLFILAFDESWAARATVTHATSTEAHLAIEKVFTFRAQDQSLWSDGTLEVFWDGSAYGARRVSDKIRINGVGYLTEAQAADAARRSYPGRAAA